MLYNFQIMLTTKCSLECLACLRNDEYYKKNMMEWNWDFDISDFKKQFTIDVLKQTNSIQFTGSIGDVIFYDKLLYLLLYICNCNHTVFITMHTNGNYRNISWWKALAVILKKFNKHVVVFAIDGMENTYSLYRVNGDFNKVITNARAFISGGGTAHWKYIKMKHNEIDIKKAKLKSIELGFKYFSIEKPWNVSTTSKLYNQNVVK